jgi:glutathione S-transferase
MPDLLRVYGLDLSYFTGKLEAYLRYKAIPFERVELSSRLFRHVASMTGIAQMPSVERADGRWMTDTTAIIAALESEYPDPPVIPSDPVQAWFSFFLEDYADEWLWRLPCIIAGVFRSMRG